MTSSFLQKDLLEADVHAVDQHGTTVLGTENDVKLVLINQALFVNVFARHAMVFVGLLT